MEEYMKKQQAAKIAVGAPKTISAAQAQKDLTESSDKYTDEDFESMSKSKGTSSQIDAAVRLVQESRGRP